MSDDRDLIARLERIEAELALHRLAQHYCVAADHRDLELWRTVWTPDAVWETGADPDHVFNGIDAICAAVQQQWQAFPIMQHGTVNPARRPAPRSVARATGARRYRDR